jgi:hypothetical protein
LPLCRETLAASKSFASSSTFLHREPHLFSWRALDCGRRGRDSRILGRSHSNNQPHLQTEVPYESPAKTPRCVHQCATRPSTILRQPFSVSFADSSILIRLWIVSFASSPSKSSGLKLFARPKPEIKPIRANSQHQNNQNTHGILYSAGGAEVCPS